MKRPSVTTHLPLFELSKISKSLSLPLNNKKAPEQVEELRKAYLQPTEEFVSYLNSIGQEYPFCVYYKEKRNDPL